MTNKEWVITSLSLSASLSLLYFSTLSIEAAVVNQPTNETLPPNIIPLGSTSEFSSFGYSYPPMINGKYDMSPMKFGMTIADAFPEYLSQAEQNGLQFWIRAKYVLGDCPTDGSKINLYDSNSYERFGYTSNAWKLLNLGLRTGFVSIDEPIGLNDGCFDTSFLTNHGVKILVGHAIPKESIMDQVLQSRLTQQILDTNLALNASFSGANFNYLRDDLTNKLIDNESFWFASQNLDKAFFLYVPAMSSRNISYEIMLFNTVATKIAGAGKTIFWDFPQNCGELGCGPQYFNSDQLGFIKSGGIVSRVISEVAPFAVAGEQNSLIAFANNDYADRTVSFQNGEKGATTTQGTLTKQTPYNGDGNAVGILDTTFRTIYATPTNSTSAPIVGGTAAVYIMAVPAQDTPAADDYTDTLTFRATSTY